MNKNKLLILFLVIILSSNQVIAEWAYFLAPPQAGIFTIQRDLEPLFNKEELDNIIKNESEYSDIEVWEMIRNRFCDGRIAEAVYLILFMHPYPHEKYYEKKIKLLDELITLQETETSIAANFKQSRYSPVPDELKKILVSSEISIDRNLLFSVGDILARLGLVTIPLYIAESFPQQRGDIEKYHDIVSYIVDYSEIDEGRVEIVFDNVEKLIFEMRGPTREYLVKTVLLQEIVERAKDTGIERAGNIGVKLAGMSHDDDISLAHKIAQQLVLIEEKGRDKNRDYAQVVRIGKALLNNPHPRRVPRHGMHCEDLLVELSHVSAPHLCELAIEFLLKHNFSKGNSYLNGYLKSIVELDPDNVLMLRLSLKIGLKPNNDEQVDKSL